MCPQLGPYPAQMCSANGWVEGEENMALLVYSDFAIICLLPAMSVTLRQLLGVDTVLTRQTSMLTLTMNGMKI